MKFTTTVKRIGKYTKYITLPPKDSYKEELEEGDKVDVEIKKSDTNDKNRNRDQEQRQDQDRD